NVRSKPRRFHDSRLEFINPRTSVGVVVSFGRERRDSATAPQCRSLIPRWVGGLWGDNDAKTRGKDLDPAALDITHRGIGGRPKAVGRVHADPGIRSVHRRLHKSTSSFG